MPANVQQASPGKRINTSLFPGVSRVQIVLSCRNYSHCEADSEEDSGRAEITMKMREGFQIAAQGRTADMKKAPVGAFLSTKFIARRRKKLNRKYWRDRAVLYPA